MKGTRRAAMMSIGVALLWAGLAAGVQGYVGAPGAVGSEQGKDWAQLKGHVLCAGCSLEELRATLPAPPAHLYHLNHRQRQGVMEVNPDDASLLYHRLWLKGGDPWFETLRADKNLFKEIKVFPRSVEVKSKGSLMSGNSSLTLARVVFDVDLWQEPVFARGKQEISQTKEFLLPFDILTACTLESGTYTVPCLSWWWP